MYEQHVTLTWSFILDMVIYVAKSEPLGFWEQNVFPCVKLISYTVEELNCLS